MRRGRIVGEFQADQAEQEEIMNIALSGASQAHARKEEELNA
jgi:hypothetical protein